MSNQRNRPIYDRDLQRLNDLNLSSFWWHSGGEWTSLIKDEVIPLSKEEISQEEKRESAHKPVLYSVFAIFILLSLAILTRTGNTFGAIEAENQNSTQQIIFSQK
jgi:hypothetical protein